MPFLCYFYLICSSTTWNTNTVDHFRTERMLEAAWGARARGRLECGSSYWLEAQRSLFLHKVRPALSTHLQCFGYGYGSGSSILGRIVIQGFDDQKLNKITANKKIQLFFISKIAIYLSLGLHKGRPSYKRSLQPSRKNIQHLKRWNFLIFFLLFCGSFLPSWIWIRIPNPDPLAWYQHSPS